MKKICKILAAMLLLLIVSCSVLQRNALRKGLIIKSINAYAQAEQYDFNRGYQFYRITVPTTIYYLGEYYGYTELTIYTRIASSSMGMSASWFRVWHEKHSTPVYPLHWRKNVQNLFCSRIYESDWNFDRSWEYTNPSLGTIYYYVEIKAVVKIINEQEKKVTKIERFRITGLD